MATILDVFISVFEADTKGLQDGQKKAAQTTDDLTDAMRESEKQAKASADKIATFAKGALGFLATAFSVSKAIGSSIQQADMIVTLDRTATAIGANVSELDALQRAFGDAGASAEASGQAATSVFESAMEASRDAASEQSRLFGLLGINIKDANGQMKGGVDLMAELAGAAEGLSDTTATDLFKRMGITDPAVQEQLLRGRKALEDQMRAHKEAGVVSERQVEVARKYQEAQAKLSSSMRRGAQTVMGFFLPAITWTVDKLADLVDWAQQNKFAVAGFFGTIAAVVATLYVPAMIKAAIATLAATWPILAIAAAIGIAAAAIALIVDDVMNWIRGNDSLIGQLIEKFPIIGTVIDAVVNAVKSLSQGFVTLWDMASGAIDWLMGAATQMASTWIGMVDAIVSALVGGFTQIRDFISGIITWIFDKVNKVINAVKKVGRFFGIGRGSDGDEDDVNLDDLAQEADAAIDRAERLDESAGPAEIAAAANSRMEAVAGHELNPVTSSSISNSTRSSESNVSIGELKIETQATDAQGVARDARSELQDQLYDLQAESASGVER